MCYPLCPVRWRFWLIDLPARLTEIGAAWFRLYSLVILWIVAISTPTVTVAVLVLWYGFGIRWGW